MRIAGTAYKRGWRWRFAKERRSTRLLRRGARWSDDDDLLAMEPLRDGNIIYNFHFTSPHVFTHQGATWGENYWHEVKKSSLPIVRRKARSAWRRTWRTRKSGCG